MLDSAEVKRIARRMGADLVGIASMDRFEGAPPEMDPRMIMPRAKSMIVCAFRINRGALRGIEEGTHFTSYAAMGYGAINTVIMPTFVINFARIFEDEGYEAIPFGFQSNFGGNIDHWRKPTEDNPLPHKSDLDGKLRSKPVAEGKPVPDVTIHMRIAAYLAGLGEIGLSKVFLTPQFGPRQRLTLVLTEMELEPDPIMEPGSVCLNCGACIRECPPQAYDYEKRVHVNLAGHDVSWAEFDPEKCLWGFRGAVPTEEGEKGYYISGREDFKPGPITPFAHKPGNVYTHGEAICGGRGCMRACMVALEKAGTLQNKFKSPFRTEKPWKVDWSDYDPNDPAVQ